MLACFQPYMFKHKMLYALTCKLMICMDCLQLLCVQICTRCKILDVTCIAIVLFFISFHHLGQSMLEFHKHQCNHTINADYGDCSIRVYQFIDDTVCCLLKISRFYRLLYCHKKFSIITAIKCP